MTSNRHRVRAASGKLFVQILLVMGALAILLPLGMMFLSSLKSNTEIYTDPFGVHFDRLEWDNYLQALAGPSRNQSLLTYYRNTMVVAILSLSVAMLIGTIAGYALARSRSQVVAGLNRYFVLLIAVPLLVTITPIFSLMGTLGLRNNVVGLALVYSAMMLPVTILLTRAYFSSFPTDVLDAAQVDGLSEFGIMRRIVLPIAAPSLVGVLMINLIWVWSELAFALALQIRPETKTLPVGLLAFKGQYTSDLGVQFAGLVLTVIPLLVLFAIFNRRITGSMSAGVTK